MILALVVILFFGLRASRFQIKKVVIEGESVVAATNIVALVNSILDTKYLMLFSKRNIFLYPKDRIATAITRDFDRIFSAELTVHDNRELVVRVVDRKPFAIWCGSVRITGAVDCYFIDADGRIFAQAPYFSGTAFIKYYGVVVGEAIGSQLLDAERFLELGNFVLSLRKLKLEPQDVVLGPVMHEVYFRDGSKIIFSPDDSYGDLFKNLKTILASAAFEGARVSTHPFEYIDLRFGNRIFYK